MLQLVLLWYSNLEPDNSKHIGKMAELVEQPRAMGTALDDTLEMGILVASINVIELQLVTAEIETLSEDTLSGEDVTGRLIEECTSHKEEMEHRDRANSASTACGICRLKNDTTENCWLSPTNPSSRFNLPSRTVDLSKIENYKQPSEKKTKRAKMNGRKKQKSDYRSTTVNMKNRIRRPDIMMMDSGTSSHMKPKSKWVSIEQSCNVFISLADDSTVAPKKNGTGIVHWKSKEKRRK